MFSASFSVETIMEIDGVGGDMFLTLVERRRRNVQSIQGEHARCGPQRFGSISLRPNSVGGDSLNRNGPFISHASEDQEDFVRRVMQNSADSRPPIEYDRLSSMSDFLTIQPPTL